MKKKLFFYLMLLISLNNYAQTINVSTGVTATGQPVTQTTPDPNWNIVSGPAGFIPQQAFVVPTYTFNWQPTPINVTNAQWVNNVLNYISNPGDYIYERSFNVGSGTTSLNCNFGIAFDDTLISLELVPPTGSSIPLTVVSSNFYNISNPITNSISNPAIGTWKIRAKINYFDNVGGFMLSGYVTLANSGTTCSSTASDFNSLYTGLATNTATYTDHETLDLEVHSYTFSVNTQKTICSIGYKAQPNLAARTYEIKITDVGNNTVLYDGFHLFSTTSTSYVTPSSSIILNPGRVYKIERIQNNYSGISGGVGNTIGRLIDNSFSPMTFPQTFGSINVLSASAYDVGTTPTFFSNNFIPYIDIRFQTPISLPTTTLLPSVCGSTLSTIGSIIGATTLGPPVTNYQFEITDTVTGQVQYSVPNGAPHFYINQLPTYQYARTYSIRVRVMVSGVWGNYGTACNVTTPNVVLPAGQAQVIASQCGSTLSSLSTLISTTSLGGVQCYRFKITDLNTGQVQTITRSLNWFSLTMLSNYNYGTTYKIEVAVSTDCTNFTAYGNPCNVSTPAVPSLTTYCGLTVPTKGTCIATASLSNVTSYSFTIEKLDALGNVIATVVIIKPSYQNCFTFNDLQSIASNFYSPNTNYRIKIAVMTAGTWSPLSTASCTITSPPIPRMMQPNEDTTVFEAIASPNPFDSFIELTLNSDSKDDIELVVNDIFGKIVEQKEIPFNDLKAQEIGTNYASGMYVIHVKQGQNSKTMKVIKK
ncbi:T9SS type A sorting domain-containing protein [Flavobacterium sp.]|uniref:T9SS type A sorting domain-containing protein n=1 Tax=Flavobacterium sp. TaxID=239 RepID=UPI0035B0299E